MYNEPFAKYVSAIYRHQQILINHYLKPYGIGSGQHIFFKHICKLEGINQKDLSELMLIDKTTTAKALKKLEREGYIYRVQDENDKRYLNLYVTDKGRELAPILDEKLYKVTSMLGERMTEEEHREAIKYLKKILGNARHYVEEIREER